MIWLLIKIMVPFPYVDVDAKIEASFPTIDLCLKEYAKVIKITDPGTRYICHGEKLTRKLSAANPPAFCWGPDDKYKWGWPCDMRYIGMEENR